MLAGAFSRECVGDQAVGRIDRLQEIAERGALKLVEHLLVHLLVHPGQDTLMAPSERGQLSLHEDL